MTIEHCWYSISIEINQQETDMKKGAIADFINWYNNEFKRDPLYLTMENTTEDSPFHRERTVGAHTDMVVMTLLGLQNENTTVKPRLMALFAAAFHDVGKPAMAEAKHSDSRGNYVSFAGHELRSARMWEDYFMRNISMFRNRFNASSSFLYGVLVMIEKHRPWGIKDQGKLDDIFITLSRYNAVDEYFNLLIADNSGRISDYSTSYRESIEKVDIYKQSMGDLNSRVGKRISKKNNANVKFENEGRTFIPSLIIPVGAAGSGKSTMFENFDDKLDGIDGTPTVSHSMDTLRREIYPDAQTPEEAFQFSINDQKNFQKQVQADFIAKVKRGENIFVDNTNVSNKRRRFYISEAQRRGYRIIGILFPISVQDLTARNAGRGDKKLPLDAVLRQYMAISVPLFGDFDQIIMLRP